MYKKIEIFTRKHFHVFRDIQDTQSEEVLHSMEAGKKKKKIKKRNKLK